MSTSLLTNGFFCVIKGQSYFLEKNVSRFYLANLDDDI